MNLEQQKKQARELLQAIRAGNETAISCLRRHHSRWTTMDEATVRQLVALHDAQFVLAREQGFASWPKLKTYTEPSSHSRHARLFVADVAWITDRVHGLMRTRQSAGPAALEQIREWHPRFADCTDEEIRQAPFTEEDARLVYAREHGFETWDDLTSRVNLLASTADAATTEPFMAAFGALRSGDVAGFEALLRSDPRLANQRGTNGNTLLSLAVSFAAKPDWKGGTSAIEALLAKAGAAVNDARTPIVAGLRCVMRLAYATNKYRRSRKMLVAERRGAGCGSAWRGRNSLNRCAFLGASRGLLRSAGTPCSVARGQSSCSGRPWHFGTGRRLLHPRWHTHSRGLRCPRILPPAQRLSELAAVDRPAGGARRSTGVGLQEQPRLRA